MSEWRPSKLGKVASFSSGGTPSLENSAYWNGDIPWVSASSMKTTRLAITDRMITQNGLDKGSRLAEKSSILILVRGSELHHRIPIGIATRDLAFNQDIKSLSVKEEVLPEYLLYWLLGNEKLLMSKVEYTGIGAGKLDTDVLKGLDFIIPPLFEQRAIAHILGTLDDKIELNRHMNKTLEGIARALFKSWFIDFDPVCAKAEGKQPFGMDEESAAMFPSEFEDSNLGMMPMGWSVFTLEESITAEKGLSYKGDFLSENDGVPMHNLNSVYEGGGYKYEGIKHYTGEYKTRHKLSAGDIIVTNTEQGFDYLLIGYPAIVPKWFGCSGIFSHHIFRVQPKPDSTLKTHFLYYLLMAPLVREQIIACTNGTTVNMLSIDGLKMPRFILPPPELIEHFEKIAVPIFEKMEAIHEESQTLASMRDTLLPKLISGEVSVPIATSFKPEDANSSPFQRCGE